MAKFPGAAWNPLDDRYISGEAMYAYNRMNLHVAVSESSSLHGFFNYPGRPSSHFYVRKDGTVEQYVDTALRAEADLDGNDATISVETQGGVGDPNGQLWTDEQLETLAQLFAWAVLTHGIPARLAEDSRIGASSAGLSWHRLGIDGNFPTEPAILRGRKQLGGGMRYSSSTGKLCPGNAKILQIPSILARAREILGMPTDPLVTVDNPLPQPQPAPKPIPAPVPAPNGDIDVAQLRVVQRGDKSRDVRRVQGLLIANGFDVGRAGIDGDWGPSTDRGFTAFQNKYPETGTNGKPDHSCGPKSWAKLLGL